MSRMVSLLSKKYEFNLEEGLEFLKIERERVGRVAHPLPFIGVVNEQWCHGVRKCHDLYSQCTNKPSKGGDLCKTCAKGGGPKYGMISERLSVMKETSSVLGHYRNSKIAHYGNVMEKLGIEKDSAIAELKKFYGDDVVIPEEIWEAPKARRGRPKGSTKKSAATSDTDDEKPKRRRGRPSKKVVKESNEGEDLISQLVKGAATHNTEPETDTPAKTPAKKPAKKSAKTAKTAKTEETRLNNLQDKWRAKATEMGKEGDEIEQFVQKETEKRAARLEKTKAAKEAKTMTPQAVSQVDDLVDKVNELTVQGTPPTEDQEMVEEEVQEEEEDDDEVSVQEQEIGGKTYLVDPSTNHVYDADAEDAGEPIGVWNEEEDRVDEL